MSDYDDPNPPRFNISEDGASYPLDKMTQRERSPRAAGKRMVEQGGRMPPQATEVEKSVLGAMLIERDAIPRAIEILPPDTFYLTRHQIM